MPCTAKQLLKVAKSQVGVTESPRNSNKTKYGKEYGQDGQPWCAMFVWWCFQHAKAPELYYGGKKTAYCPTLADYYIAQKRTVKKSNGKPGDIVFFDFDGNGNSDHVGLIYKKVNSTTYYTIEGNTGYGNNANGGKVMVRERSTAVISRIARPKYKKPATTTTAKKTSYPTLRKGSSGSAVKTLQKKLGIKADGIFGPQTEKAVKNFQKKNKLAVDGVVGKKTWAKLTK